MTDHERTASSSASQGPRTPAGDGADSADGPSTAQVIQNLRNLAGELADYASYYVSAKLDGVKWSLTKLVMMLALAAIALLVLSGAVVTAVVLLMVGIANGIGTIFGENLRWIGWLITGAAVLGGIVGATLIAMRVMQSKTRQRLERKYETKRQRQQYDYGRNVRSRAAGSSESVSPT